MTKFATLAILAIVATGPTAILADGYSGTITGQNGGTAVFSGTCDRSEGGTSCTRDSVLTSPKGKTATRKLNRDFSKGRVATTATTTGEGGRSVTKTREWNR